MELASLLKTEYDKILMIIRLLINTGPFFYFFIFFSLFIYLSILFLVVMSALTGARSGMFRFKSLHIRFLWTFQTAFFLAGGHVVTACRYAKYVYFDKCGCLRIHIDWYLWMWGARADVSFIVRKRVIIWKIMEIVSENPRNECDPPEWAGSSVMSSNKSSSSPIWKQD